MHTECKNVIKLERKEGKTMSTTIISYTDFLRLQHGKEGTVRPHDLFMFLVDKHSVTFEEARALFYQLQDQGDLKLTPDYSIMYNAPNKAQLTVGK